MAANLWGKVYYKADFAGILTEDAGGRCVFTYDPSYLESGKPTIAYTLPLQKEPHISEIGLHPFFDNLVAEGWLRDAQARALGIRKSDRFSLLLAFGSDCAGAVTVIDPAPLHEIKIDMEDPQDFAALAGRASLSGIQPKLGVVWEGKSFRPSIQGELSTHIAKLPSGGIPDIVENEYLTTMTSKALLRGDEIVEMEIGTLPNIAETALFIKRFDRTSNGEKRHFEEFSQLLNRASEDKYDASYEDMSNFIFGNDRLCLRSESEKLYRRILACILLGNTDAHLKNFAMFHTEDGLRLTPAYDLVASAAYKEYQTMALGIEKAQNLRIGNLQPKNIARLGQLYHLPRGAIMLAVEDFEKRLDKTQEAVAKAKNVRNSLKDKLHEMIEKRWNGIFASIGNYLSKKP